MDDAIDTNAIIAERIYEIGLGSFRYVDSCGDDGHSSVAAMIDEKKFTLEKEEKRSDNALPSSSLPKWAKASPNDVEKAQSTIRQLFRDWSAEGVKERETTYGPVLRALEHEFPTPVNAGDGKSARRLDRKFKVVDRGSVRILVPGAGLGRLVFEVCRAGFVVEGNELSYHQLLTSSFILNHTDFAEQYALHPWALSFSNHVSREVQLQKVLIPDVHPGTTLHAASEGHTIHAFDRISMCAADFCIVYKEEEYRNHFDAVTTVFFIDTAPDLIAYVETIKNCLKVNGIWINLGPLLWHFGGEPKEAKNNGSPLDENNDKPDKDQPSASRAGSTAQKNLGIGEPGSVELSEDEVIKLVQHYGFTIEKHEYLRTGYIQNSSSMLQQEYIPSFWIARKMEDF